MANYTITASVTNSKFGASIAYTETTAIDGDGSSSDPWGGSTGLSTNDTVTIANASGSGSSIVISGVNTTFWTETSTGNFTIAAGSSKTFTVASQGNSDDHWLVQYYDTAVPANTYSSNIYFSNAAASNFETAFLSTTTTSRRVAAKITNVTESISQTLALSFAGNSYTLTELSTDVGDTVVITFYYTDGESKGKNQVRLKQTGGTGATATIGGIYTGGTISSIQNAGASGDPTLSGFPDPSTNNTFTISTSTQLLASSVHEAVTVNGSDPGDRYQVGFSFTIPTGITKIELQNEDDDDEAGYTTTLTFPISVGAGLTAPTASSVTFSDPNSLNTTATVNLSASGSGGTLEYACEVGDTTPDNWQSSNTFTITRGSGTVYARARRSTTALSNIVNATRPAFKTLGGDEEVGDQIISSSFTGDLSVDVANSTPTFEVFAIATSAGLSDSQVDSQAIVSGSSGTPVSLDIPSANLPTAGNTNTFYLYGKRSASSGGDDLYTQIDTFTVQRQTAGGSGGSATHGINVFGPDNSTVVFGTNLLATNFVVAQAFSLAASATTTITCKDANDDSKVLIFFAQYERGVIVSAKTSTNFTLQNTGSSTRSGTVFAIRKR